MRVLLLTRRSSFQIYCANELFKKDILTDVLFEEGSSFVSPLRKTLKNKLIKSAKGILRPVLLVRKIANTIKSGSYYGNKEFHDRRILGSDFKSWSGGLRVWKTDDINSEDSLENIKKIKPDFVFVFGTRMIKKHIINCISAPIINMHWGWSPDYRCEGIITALAYGGAKDLGVTVHHMDLTSDGGDIIFRERPLIDKMDNFYSIGLKLTRLGTELFEKTYKEYRVSGKLSGVKQDLLKGGLYTSKFMAEHPELLQLAWSNLKGSASKRP